MFSPDIHRAGFRALAPAVLGALLISCGMGQDIVIQPELPPVIAYASPQAFSVGVAATQAVSSTGGPVTGYAIAPPLPQGLVLDGGTGAITGVAVAASAQSEYVVVATGPGGADTAVFLLRAVTVPVDPTVPRPEIAYASPVSDTAGKAASHPVISSGGPVTGFSVVTPLPAGLTLNASSGLIAGTPTTQSNMDAYAVIAYGPGGRDTATIVITVAANPNVAPPQIAYASPVTDTVGRPAAHAVISTGGPVTSHALYSTDALEVLPETHPAMDMPDSYFLPSGLTLNTATGMISGTPAQAKAAATHTIIATGPGGADTATIRITVVANPNMASPQVAYASPVTDTVGRPAAHAVISTGGPVTSYTLLSFDGVPGVLPKPQLTIIGPDPFALPSGLTLNTSTGMISGTPTQVKDAATYSIMATGPGGSHTATIRITVVQLALPVSPPVIAYASPATDTVGRPASHAAISSGGPVTSYSVSPALPPGLSLNVSSGTVSGTPTGAKVAANYFVIAQGPGGKDTAQLKITVVFGLDDQPVPTPGPLAYWDFNEGAGTILTDRAGGGRNATISGATWTTGIEGAALRFDGSNDYAESMSSLPDMARQTMMAWVFVESIRESYLFGEGDGSSGHDNTLSIRPNTGRFLYRTHDSDPGDQHSSRAALQTGRWHHLAGVCTGDSVLLYLDGQRDTVYTGRAFNLNGFHHRLQFGRFNDGGGGRLYFQGRLDEIKVYNVALTPAQIQKEWLSHAPIIVPSLDPDPLPKPSGR